MTNSNTNSNASDIPIDYTRRPTADEIRLATAFLARNAAEKHNDARKATPEEIEAIKKFQN